MLTRAGLKPVEITFQDMGRNLLKHLTAEVLSRCFLYLSKAPLLHSNVQSNVNTRSTQRWNIVTANVIFLQFYFFFLDFPSETSKSGRASCHLIGLDLHRFESKDIQRKVMTTQPVDAPRGYGQ